MGAAGADTRRGPAVALASVLGAGVLAAGVDGGAYGLIARTEAFVLLWWVLLLASAFTLLPRARGTRAIAISLAAFLALAAWVAVSLAWTESRERTVIELARVAGLAGVVLVVALTFNGEQWRHGVAAVTVAATGVCALAMASRLAPELFTNPLGATMLRRLAYPLNYWNALACWSAMTVALTLAWSAHAARVPVRAAALAGACLAAGVVYLTYARSGTAATVLGIAAVVALSRHRWLAAAHAAVVLAGAVAVVICVRAAPAIARGTGGEGGGKVALVLIVAMLAGALAAWLTARSGLERVRMAPARTRRALAVFGVIAAGAAAFVGPAAANRAWDSFHKPTPPLTGDPVNRLGTLGGTRDALWSAALDTFAKDPLRGSGAGTFEFTWNRDRHRAYFVRDAHSLYLESLSELGLPGTLAVLAAVGALLVAAMRTAVRARDAAGPATGAAAALLVYCVCAGVDWMWESTAVTAAALALGGLAATRGARPAGPLGAPRRAIVIAVAAGGLAVQLPVLASAVQVQSSQRAIRVGDFDEAVSAATTAVQVAPWAASGYSQRALVLEQLGFGARAEADGRRAAQREPTNWKMWLVLARIEAERGRIRPALAHARRAASLNRRAPLFATARPRPRRP
jgi:O-Antigen ligase